MAAELHPQVRAAVQLDGHDGLPRSDPAYDTPRARGRSRRIRAAAARRRAGAGGPRRARVACCACGLCGSDVEKLGPRRAGTVLGHEVVAETADGDAGRAAPPPAVRRRARAASPGTSRPARRSRRRRSGRAGSPSACAPQRLGRAPGRARRRARRRWSSRSPACCAASSACRAGRVLVVGNGFVGRLFGAVLERRGDEVFAVDADPRRERARSRRAGRRGGALRAAAAPRRRSTRSSRAGRSSSSPTPARSPPPRSTAAS